MPQRLLLGWGGVSLVIVLYLVAWRLIKARWVPSSYGRKGLSMGINDKEIGQRMRARRIELGLSVTRVAMELNFTVEHYRMLETGARKQTLATVTAFSELYHVSMDYLIHGYSNDDQIQSALRTIISLLTNIYNQIFHA